MRTTNLILAVLALALLPAQAMALTLWSGNHTFNVDVRNQQFQTVNEARGTIWNQGPNQVRIDVQSPGYRAGWVYLYLNPNQTSYYAQVQLQEPTSFFWVVDAAQAAIPGAYARQNQIGAWGDEFRFEVTLPKAGFTKFGPFDVQVRNGGLMFGERIYVRDLGNARLVEITVKRREMNEFSNNFTIVIPRDEQLPAQRREVVRDLSFRLAQESDQLTATQRTAVQERLDALKRAAQD